MRTATVRDLRNRYTSLLAWIGAGEEIVITRRGKVIARLVPERTDESQRVDWRESPAVQRDRSGASNLPALDSLGLIREAGGHW